MAHLVVQVILNLILLVEARLGVGRLGPKVGNVVGAAQLQGYKMIDLKLPWGGADDAVLSVDLILLTGGDVSDT
ncbi:MAG: hypothetical protein ABSB61_04580 [Anaerolineales bacterium]